MADLDSTLASIQRTSSWNTRVALVRKVPEDFGLAQQAAVYSAIAKAIYVPNLVSDFAYVTWREEYELPAIESAYRKAHDLTSGFRDVGVDRLAEVIRGEPTSLKIFRLLLGLLPQEFAATTGLVASESGLPVSSSSRIKGIEAGTRPPPKVARCCAEVIVRVMSGTLFPPTSTKRRRKADKPDTSQGWASVREYAKQGVPFPVFLHQRHYGGSFRQLLDATSTVRGNILEVAVQDLLMSHGVLFLRTGAANQGEIETRFGVTVKPAPDFVVFDQHDSLRAILECKATNDGGTARDKAARYRALRQESVRLGGVPLFAVLGGLGWKRTADALGPVVRDTDGRTFMLGNLSDMLTVSPFPTLARK
jgi:hypothetical protein